MAPPALSRPEAEWIAALAAGEGAAIEQLHRVVRAKLGAALGRRPNVDDADLDDFTQDACVRILATLGSFRGDARFTTWIGAVAVRVALTELRKRRWSAERTGAEWERLGGALVDAREASRGAARDELFAALREAINHSLSARQRQVVLAELEGLPIVRIAEALGAKPNAVYKVGHDARRKLRAALESAGFAAEAVRGLLSDETDRRPDGGGTTQR